MLWPHKHLFFYYGFYILYLYNIMVQQLITGPVPQVQPTLAGSGQSSALMSGLLNQRNASALNELAGGFKGIRRTSRKSRRSTRSRRNKTKGRKLSRRNKRSKKLRGKRSTKRSRMYKGGAGQPIPYSAPSGSNAAVLNISEELAIAHAAANTNARFDAAARNAP